jgi:hypothetical protein
MTARDHTLHIDTALIDQLELMLLQLRTVAENPDCCVTLCGSVLLHQQWHTVLEDITEMNDYVDVYCLGQSGR